MEKTKRGLMKHPVETYKHYNIYIVAGMTPAFFIAEKVNPAKGTTLTADSLEQLKKDVDKILDYAAGMKINVWEGPERNGAFPKGFVPIKSNGVNLNGFAIVVRCDYDIDAICSIAYKQPLRVSKRYRKSNKRWNLAKFLNNSTTVCQGR